MVMPDTLLTVFTLSIVKTGGGVRCGVIKCITPYCTNWWSPLGFSNSNPLTLHIFSIGVLVSIISILLSLAFTISLSGSVKMASKAASRNQRIDKP